MNHDDPVVQRVREARRRIAASCDYDLHKLYEWAKQIEARYKDRVIGLEEFRKRREESHDPEKPNLSQDDI